MIDAPGTTGRPGRPTPARTHELLDPSASADAGAMTLRTAASLGDWARGLGAPFDPRAAPLAAMIPAFAAPWSPPEVCFLAGRTALWALALDARTDGPDARPHAVERGLAHLRAVAVGSTPGADPLARALAGIRHDLLSGPNGAVLAPVWEDAALAALDGTLFEFRAARRMSLGHPAPTLDAYLHHARGSIGFALVVLALWSDPAVGEEAAGAADLRQACRVASLATRLANDLSGVARERDEGTLNAILLGLPPRTARRRVHRLLTDCRESLRPRTATGCPAALALERQLLWSVRQYRHGDLGH
ncbi:terpene synthase family protein (plasmid) [Streptomyces sp. BI20]|uniref:terpene synthase family protein n=1 Tax=Streptomyces sp. BI20 TaxID=3403460 RepID=UPI003C74F4A3